MAPGSAHTHEFSTTRYGPPTHVQFPMTVANIWSKHVYAMRILYLGGGGAKHGELCPIPVQIRNDELSGAEAVDLF